jgi:hypothetical protein
VSEKTTLNTMLQNNNTEEILRQAKMNVGIGVSPTNQQATMALEKTNAGRRQEFLETVRNFVCKDRNVTHGDAEDNFRVIATLWETYLNNTPPQNLNSVDVAIMMCLFKTARLMANPKNMENWHDLAGYAACGGGIVMKRLEEEKP